MKSTFAKVTGLALLAASFAFCGSLAYADTEDATSIQILTFDAVGNPGEIIAVLDCDTEDGIGSCPLETLLAAEDPTQDKTTSDASAPQPNEEKAGEASAAIVVEVTQSSAVVVAGQATEDELVVTGTIAQPSATTSMLDGKNCDEDF